MATLVRRDQNGYTIRFKYRANDDSLDDLILSFEPESPVPSLEPRQPRSNEIGELAHQ